MIYQNYHLFKFRKFKNDEIWNKTQQKKYVYIHSNSKKKKKLKLYIYMQNKISFTFVSPWNVFVSCSATFAVILNKYVNATSLLLT